ncbi:MAG TPA: DUF1127 domain-containing protein [Xanthobacteraceae bacterium]|jgi:uncharacterized protein YjiS (DUF1127 family)
MTTTALTASTTTGFLFALAGKVARRVVEARQAYRHRRAIATLAGFDDRMLQDIGLTRGDLRDAAAEPLWRDPTAVLVMRSRERRRGAIFSWGGRVEAPPIVPAVDLDEWSSTLFPARSRYY